MLQFMGPGVSRGEDWLPDEIAKVLVKEKSLSKGHTVSKREILDFLSEKGISNMLVTDVAIVLRNVFGITPTFDEDKTMSASNLIEELTAVLEGRETAKVVVESTGPALIVKRDPFDVAVEGAFFSAETPLDEAVVACLAEAGPAVTFDIAEMVAGFSDADFAEMDECLQRGGMGLVESWTEARTRPHMIRFMEDKVRHELREAVQAAGFRTLDTLSESPHELDLPTGGDVELAKANKPKKKMRPPMVKGTPAAHGDHKGPPGISVPGLSGHKDEPKASPAAPTAKPAAAPALQRAAEVPPAPTAAQAAKPSAAPAHTPSPSGHVPPGGHTLSTHPMAQGGKLPPPPEKRVDLDPSAKRGGIMKRGLAAMGNMLGKIKSLGHGLGGSHPEAPAGDEMGHEVAHQGMLSKIGHAATGIAKGAIAAPFGALGYGAGVAAGGLKQGLGMMGRGFHAAYAAGQHAGAQTPLAQKMRMKAPGLAHTLYGQPGGGHGGGEHDDGGGEHEAPHQPTEPQQSKGGLKRKFPKQPKPAAGA